MACATTEYSTEYVVCTSPGHQHTFALHNVRDRRAIPASCRSLFLRVRLRAAAGKENTDWNFQGQCKGQSCLRLFFFFSGATRERTFNAVSIYLCFTGRVLRARCRVNTGMSPLLFCLTDWSLSPCQRGKLWWWIDCYDVQHIGSPQPRCWGSLIAWYYVLYTLLCSEFPL